MNITHFVENLNRGGLERMVLELVQWQQAQGHSCQVVCLYDEGALAAELLTTPIAVRACGKRSGMDLRALARARRLIRAHGTEVLHTHNAVAHYQAVLASRGLGVRCVINTRHGMGGNARLARREWLYRRALAGTDVAVTVCEAARRDAVARGILPAAKARVVPNGIRLSTLSAGGGCREALRQTLQLPTATRLIGSVGRLNWAKDQAGLIRAFATLHRQRSNTALLLIGDGELRDALRQVAQEEGMTDSVHFLGDRNDVPELLAGLDLFVLSSLSEGYSMALLEACAAALPIIATDVGGNGEIVRDGDTGCLVPARDPAALAAAMMALLDDPARAAALGRAACTWVAAHGSVDAMARRYAQLYQSVTTRDGQ